VREREREREKERREKRQRERERERERGVVWKVVRMMKRDRDRNNRVRLLEP
jgi:hypothetical protein